MSPTDKTYLLENSLYDVNDPATKDAYLKDSKQIVNSFLFNFIGIVAIYASTQKKEAIQRYVTSDKQVRVSNIGDDNNDMTIAVKAMADNNMFITTKTVTEITRFIAKFKTKQIDKVDTTILQGWIEQIKPAELKSNINGRMKGILDDFKKTQSLLGLAHGLKIAARIRTTKGVGAEFKELSKKSKLDPLKKDPAAAAAAPTTAPVAPAPATVAPIVPAPSVQKATPTPDPIVQKPAVLLSDFDVKRVFEDLRDMQISHDDVVSMYKAPTLAQKKEIVSLTRDRVFVKSWRNKSGEVDIDFIGSPASVNLFTWIADNVAATFKSSLLDRVMKTYREKIDIIAFSTRVRNENLRAISSYILMLDVLGETPADVNFKSSVKTARAILHNVAMLYDAQTGFFEKVLSPELQFIINTIKNAPKGDWLNIDALAGLVKRGNHEITGFKPFVIAHNFARGPDHFAALFNQIQRAYQFKVKGSDIKWVMAGRLHADHIDLSSDNIHTMVLKIMSSWNIVQAGASSTAALIFSKKFDRISTLSLYNQMDSDPDLADTVAKNIDMMTSRDQLDIVEAFVTSQFLAKSDWQTDPDPIYEKVNIRYLDVRVALQKLIGRLVSDLGIGNPFFETTSKRLIERQAAVGLVAAQKAFGQKAATVLLEAAGRRFASSTLMSDDARKTVWRQDNGPDDGKHFSTIKQFSPSTASMLITLWMQDVDAELNVSDAAGYSTPQWFDKTVIRSKSDGLRKNSPQAFQDKLDISNLEISFSSVLSVLSSNESVYSEVSNLERILKNVPKYSNMNPKIKQLTKDFVAKLNAAAESDFGDRLDINLSYSVDVLGAVVDEELVDEFGDALIGGLSASFGVSKLSDKPSWLGPGWSKTPVATITKLINKQMTDPNKVEMLKTLVRSASTSSVENLLAAAKFTNHITDKDVRDIMMGQLSVANLVSTNPPSILAKQVATNIHTMVHPLDTDMGSDINQDVKNDIFIQAVSAADELCSKTSASFKDSIPTLLAGFVTAMEEDKVKADAAYSKLSTSMKRRIANAYIQRQTFVGDALDALGNTGSNPDPIFPYEKLDHKRIMEILKYNNIITEESKLPVSKIRDMAALDNEVNNRDKLDFPKLQVAETTLSKSEMEKLSVKMHLKLRNNRHGRNGMVMLRSFNVAIPVQADLQEKFLTSKPDSEIINPMFHGTGSVAASMILRTGFRVVASGDASVVGRMLGDGIYGAIHIDKAQQYVGDSGFTRASGTKGYIFEMNAVLGEPGQDYNVAGLGGDTIRSPEWCVFNANAQYKIYKAHEVVVVQETTMDNLVEKYRGEIALEEGLVKFGKYLNENKSSSSNVNQMTFTFLTGVIPTSDIDSVDFEEFKSKRDNVWIEPSAYGPMVVINDTDESESYTIRSVVEFKADHPELFDRFLAAIS